MVVTEREVVAVSVCERVFIGVKEEDGLILEVLDARDDEDVVIVLYIVMDVRAVPDSVLLEVLVFDILVLFDTVGEVVDVFEAIDTVPVGDADEVFDGKGDFV